MVNQLASGVAFVPPDYDEFRLIAITNHGNLRSIASKLNVAPITLYSYFKRDPKAKEILDEVRGYNTATDVDLAEFVIRFNMTNYKEEPSIAQRAAEFTLGYKGKDRGWIKDQVDDDLDISSVNKAMDLIDLLQSKSLDLSIAESNINNAEKSILDTGDVSA